MLLQAASTRCPLPSHAVHPFRKSASTAVSVPSQYALLILVCRQANVHSAIVLQLVQHITVEELASRGGEDLLASFLVDIEHAQLAYRENGTTTWHFYP